jgi:hypothetical protein
MECELKKEIVILQKSGLLSEFGQDLCRKLIANFDLSRLLLVLDCLLEKEVDNERFFVLSVEKFPESSDVLCKYAQYLFNKKMFVDCASFVFDNLKLLFHNYQTQIIAFKAAIFLLKEQDAYLYKKNLDILKHSDPQVEIISYYLVTKGIGKARCRLEQDSKRSQVSTEAVSVSPVNKNIIIGQFGYSQLRLVDLSQQILDCNNSLSNYYLGQRKLLELLHADDRCRKKESVIRLLLLNLENY